MLSCLNRRPPGTCALMECFFCYEITHPTCVTDYGVEGVIRMDMPNSWECPRCIKTGAVKSEIEDYDDPTCAKIPKTEPVFSPSMTDQFGNQTSNRIPIASGADTDFKGYQVFYFIWCLFFKIYTFWNMFSVNYSCFRSKKNQTHQSKY